MHLSRSKKIATFAFSAFILLANPLKAQYLLNNDSAFKAGAPNSARIWGYAFGDFFYKGHSDSLNRGGLAQYTGIPTGKTAFQFRRVYLGYDHNISKKFSVEFLLGMEDDFPAGNPPTSTTPSGDLLADNKIALYIKFMNIRWKNIWNGTDLVVGQLSTPAFSLSTEKLWSYRTIERTITDFYGGTPSFDMGISLQGAFTPKTKDFGYDIMVSNGTKAKPENNDFKWFSGDAYAKFLDKHLVFYLFADYERLNWTSTWHHSHNMIKGTAGYTAPWFTVGVEAYINNLHHDNFALKRTGGEDTLSVAAKGISVFAHGYVILDKFGYFIRLDKINPDNKINNTVYSSYTGNTPGFNDPTNTTTFFTAGLDWVPSKNVHFMPNIWYNHYKTTLAGLTGKANGDHDLVYRATFFFSFGK